jgi:peroxiredoxin
VLNPVGYRIVMTDDAVPGERAPRFATTASTGQVLSLDDFTGLVPVVLTFVGTLPATDADDVIAAYNEIFAEFGRHQVQLLIVTPESETHVRTRRRDGTTVPLLADEDGTLLERFAGSATFPATVVIDESGTVTRVLEGGSAGDHVNAVRAVVTQSTRGERSDR